MKESFKQKMQENKPHLTFKNTKKNICLKKKREFFLTLTPNPQFISQDVIRWNHLMERLLNADAKEECYVKIKHI